MKWMTWPRNQWNKLWTGEESPGAVAFGFAAGIFFGFSPLVGLKTLLSVAVTRLCRGSVVAALVAMALHDLVLPLMPFVLRWEYDIGWWLLSHPHQMPAAFPARHQALRVWAHWSTFQAVGRPLLLGSLFVCMPIAILTFFVMRAVLERARRRRTQQAAVSTQ
jgi:uncharacterized protein